MKDKAYTKGALHTCMRNARRHEHMLCAESSPRSASASCDGPLKSMGSVETHPARPWRKEQRIAVHNIL